MYILKGKVRAHYIEMSDIPACPMCGRTGLKASEGTDKGVKVEHWRCTCGTHWSEEWKLGQVTILDRKDA